MCTTYIHTQVLSRKSTGKSIKVPQSQSYASVPTTTVTTVSGGGGSKTGSTSSHCSDVISAGGSGSTAEMSTGATQETLAEGKMRTQALRLLASLVLAQY